MEDNEWLAQRFEKNQIHLRAVAYRMLGPLSQAPRCPHPLAGNDDPSARLGTWVNRQVCDMRTDVCARRTASTAGVRPPTAPIPRLSGRRYPHWVSPPQRTLRIAPLPSSPL